MHRYAIIIAVSMALTCHEVQSVEAPSKPAVAELLEDNADSLLMLLTNPTGDPGEGLVEKQVVFSGKSCVKIIPMQRFHSRIPGWRYRITEKPKAGEYRYLRFAWKADGCAGTMIQFHDEKDWYIRYTAGVDRYNWGTKFVAERPSEHWLVVTRDLFADFGERTITGMALTAFDGRAAYFDHIYFGRSVDDLDRIDATGLRGGKPLVLTADQLERLWSDLGAVDAAKAYLAFWTLVAAPARAVPLLKAKLAPGLAPDLKPIRQWIIELDDDRFAVREAATKRLAEVLETATPLLEQALKNNPSAEVRHRIGLLLRQRKGGNSAQQRIENAVRVLEYLGTPEAAKCLQQLAKGQDGDPVSESARAALKRIKSPPPR
jgi:hypothetical protein